MFSLMLALYVSLAFATNARVHAYADLARETFTFSDTFRLVRVLMLGSGESEPSPRPLGRHLELDGRRYFTVAEGAKAKLQFSEPINGIADHQMHSDLLEALLYARLDPGEGVLAAEPMVATRVLDEILRIKDQARASHRERSYRLAWSNSLRERLMRSYAATADIAYFRLWLEAETSRWRALDQNHALVVEPQSVGALERNGLFNLAQPGRTRNRLAVFNLVLAALAERLQYGLPAHAPDWRNARAVGAYARLALSFRELTHANLAPRADRGFESAFTELSQAVVPKAVRFAQIAPTFDEPLPTGADADSRAHTFPREAIWFREAIVTSAYYRDLISPDSAAPSCEFHLY